MKLLIYLSILICNQNHTDGQVAFLLLFILGITILSVLVYNNMFESKKNENKTKK